MSAAMTASVTYICFAGPDVWASEAVVSSACFADIVSIALNTNVVVFVGWSGAISVTSLVSGLCEIVLGVWVLLFKKFQRLNVRVI